MTNESRTLVEAVRGFSRFYTRRIGVLEEEQFGLPFTLAEMRVLYELGHQTAPGASALAAELALDPGYLSRILKAFEARGLLSRQRDPGDGRRSRLALTAAGREALAPLEARSRERVGALVESLGAADRGRLAAALTTVERLLGGPPGPVAADPVAAVALRPHRQGDLGWIVSRHGTLFAAEYGFDATFEALVAGIAAGFLSGFDPARERAFVAERDGPEGPERLGSALLVRHPEEEGTAKLRLLLVEPAARSLGLGRRLVAACTDFAREAGYTGIALWTNDCLTAARRLYVEAGYELVERAPHRSFGVDLVGETWRLDDLRPRRP